MPCVRIVKTVTLNIGIRSPLRRPLEQEVPPFGGRLPSPPETIAPLTPQPARSPALTFYHSRATRQWT